MKHCSPEKKVKALHLRNEGYSMSEICMKTGIGKWALKKFFWRARKMRIDSEPPICPADVASMFPGELFLDSSLKSVKVGEYMMYKIWQTMDEDRSLSVTQVMEALPCLAGVSRSKVQEVVAMIRKNWKTGQPQPQPPEPLLIREMPLLGALQWSQKQLKNQKNQYDFPLHQEVVDRISAAFEGPREQRRELGQRLLRVVPSFLVDMMDEQNKAE